MKQSAEEVAEQVAHALDEAQSGIHGLMEKVAGLKTAVESLREDVRLISRILLEGNGHEPMMARVSVLDREIREIKTWIEEQREMHQAYRREQIRGRWRLLTAAMPGLVTLFWSLVSLIAKR